MRYKIIQKKNIDIYQHSISYEYRKLPYIHREYKDSKVEISESYLDTEYSINVGCVVDGMKVNKIEIVQGEIILHTDYERNEWEFIGTPYEELDMKMRKYYIEKIKYLEIKILYKDIATRVVNRCTRDLYRLPNRYPLNHLPNDEIVIKDINQTRCNLWFYGMYMQLLNSKYVKTPLEKYAVRKMVGGLMADEL